MKTLDQLTAERDALNKAIEEYTDASIYLITQASEVLFLNYMPTWVKDETLIYKSEDWTREEVERIALSCKLLRKAIIFAKDQDVPSEVDWESCIFDRDIYDKFEAKHAEDFARIKELSND